MLLLLRFAALIFSLLFASLLIFSFAMLNSHWCATLLMHYAITLLFSIRFHATPLRYYGCCHMPIIAIVISPFITRCWWYFHWYFRHATLLLLIHTLSAILPLEMNIYEYIKYISDIIIVYNEGMCIEYTADTLVTLRYIDITPLLMAIRWWYGHAFADAAIRRSRYAIAAAYYYRFSLLAASFSPPRRCCFHYCCCCHWWYCWPLQIRHWYYFRQFDCRHITTLMFSLLLITPSHWCRHYVTSWCLLCCFDTCHAIATIRRCHCLCHAIFRYFDTLIRHYCRQIYMLRHYTMLTLSCLAFAFRRFQIVRYCRHHASRLPHFRHYASFSLSLAFAARCWHTAIRHIYLLPAEAEYFAGYRHAFATIDAAIDIQITLPHWHITADDITITHWW